MRKELSPVERAYKAWICCSFLESRMVQDYKSSDIPASLLSWFATNGRSFIWRERRDPFIILIAEILLKKTSAPVVNRFLTGFLERYSTIEALGNATLQELQVVLAPLGLSNQRAKQLRGLTRTMVDLYGGIIPCSREELLELPGIGEYTTGAILSFAFGQPEPIVDTNVARVIVRVYGFKPSRYEARRSPEVWDKARELVAGQKSTDGAKINWALLDLGALICRPRNPNHTSCPLEEFCAYSMSETKQS